MPRPARRLPVGLAFVLAVVTKADDEEAGRLFRAALAPEPAGAAAREHHGARGHRRPARRVRARRPGHAARPRALTAAQGERRRADKTDMDSDRPAAAQAPPAQHAAERRHVLGRIAALLFLSGALASLAANPVVHAGPVPWWAHALCALAAVSAAVCLLVPFRRLTTARCTSSSSPRRSRSGSPSPPTARGGGPFTWYFVLISVFAGYAFRTRRAVVAHLALVCAAIAAPVLGLWPGPPMPPSPRCWRSRCSWSAPAPRATCAGPSSTGTPS
jgi:hypothetical protein